MTHYLKLTAFALLAALTLAIPSTRAQFGADPGDLTAISKIKGIIQLVRDARGTKEIEMTDEQEREIAELDSRLRNAYMAVLDEHRPALEIDRDVAKFNKVVVRAEKEYVMQLMNGLDEILLPFQVERLRQLSLWAIVNRDGFPALFESPNVKEQLELNEVNAKELSKKADELQAEFEKEIVELRQKYREDLVGLVSDSKQKQLAELLGKESLLYFAMIRF